MNIASILLILVFAHFLLDWSLQDDMTKKNKSQSNFVLLVHCIIWSFGISIVLMFFGLFAWWKVAMLLFGHIAMDYWKCRGLYKKWPTRKRLVRDHDDFGPEYVTEPVIGDWTSLYIDQAFHLMQVALCLL